MEVNIDKYRITGINKKKIDKGMMEEEKKGELKWAGNQT